MKLFPYASTGIPTNATGYSNDSNNISRSRCCSINSGIIHLELQGLPTVPVNAIRAISHGFEIQGEGTLVRHSPS